MMNEEDGPSSSSCGGLPRKTEAMSVDGRQAFDKYVTSSSPLASLTSATSRAVRRRVVNRVHRRDSLRGAARTLQELETGADTLVHHDVLGSLSLRERDIMRRRIDHFGKLPVDMTALGSFNEIQGPVDYAGAGRAPAPLDINLLSLLAVGFSAAPLEILMGERGPDFVKSLCRDSVLPEEQQLERAERLGLSKPYSDPQLRNPRQRAALVTRLLESNLVEISLEDGIRVGIFTVLKSHGRRQRLIVDARLSNAAFCDPPPVDLPTGASYSRLYLEAGEELYGSACDLKDAFYTM